MQMNDSDKGLSRRQEKNLLKAADVVARTEFANPEREGCPGSETLSLLARRRPSLAESADLIDHIGTCSPCFNEYSRCRAAYKRSIRITYALASAAAVTLLAVTISRSWQSPGGHPAAPPTTVARSTEEDLTPLVLDLRMMGVSRSDNPGRPGDGQPPRLPRGRLSLSILLPIGSEDGIYDVALLGSSRQPLLTATGSAKLQDFVEVLPITFNLADLAPGPYELRIRRAQTPWNVYPILLE